MQKVLDPRPTALDRDSFLAAYGGVYEESPWIAAAVFDRGLEPAADTPDGLAAAMRDAVAAAGDQAKLALIGAHPDLAGRAAIAGDLTAASRSEQAGAGLDRCTPQEFARFQALNQAYRAKFGFPFVLAVAGLDRAAILAAFEARLGNDRDSERAEALRQIDRIARLRLEAMARPA